MVLGLGTGISSLLRIAYVVYAARVLGPAAYADLYAALSLVFLFGTAIGPISGTVSRFTSLYLAEDDAGALAGLRRFARAHVTRVAIALVVLSPLLMLGVRGQLGATDWTLPAIVVAIFPLTLLVYLPRGLVRGAHRFGHFSLQLTAEAGLRLLLSVFLLSRAATAEAALLAYLAAALLLLPIAELQARSIGRGVDPEPVDGGLLRRFGASFFLVAFIGAAFQNIDVLAARRFFPDYEAGLYGAASSLAKALALVYLPFGTLSLPTLTARFTRKERPERAVAALLGGFGALGALVLAGLVWQGERVLRLLHGEAYLEAQPLLLPLGSAMLLILLSGLIAQAFTAMGRFEFLPLYGAALVAELAILWWTQSSPIDLAWGLAASQLLTFGLVLAAFVRTSRTRQAGETP